MSSIIALSSAANYGSNWPEFGLLAYLTTCPEYEDGTFIPSGTLDNLKVVKL